MLNRRGESTHPCLVPDLSRNSFSFLPLNDISSEFVTYGLYYVEVGSLYAHFLFFCFFVFLGQQMQHMEFPRLGVELEL